MLDFAHVYKVVISNTARGLEDTLRQTQKMLDGTANAETINTYADSIGRARAHGTKALKLYDIRQAHMQTTLSDMGLGTDLATSFSAIGAAETAVRAPLASYLNGTFSVPFTTGSADVAPLAIFADDLIAFAGANTTLQQIAADLVAPVSMVTVRVTSSNFNNMPSSTTLVTKINDLRAAIMAWGISQPVI